MNHFEGENGGAYDPRSAQKFMHMAKKNAGIHNLGSIQSLRHFYATHTLEGGNHIRYIESSLGHNNPKTTLRYSLVSRIKIETLQSPLDKLEW